MQARQTPILYTHLIPYGYHPVSARRAPYVVVKLTNPASGDSVDTLALIDSGARFSLFDGAHAQGLGLVVRSGRRVTFFPAASPTAQEAFLHPLMLSINGFAFRCEVAFTEYPLARDALGREGFFDQVQIGFRELTQEIYLVLSP